jgi:peptidoglycan L-alanyl-D-glutamate endopeptidase CwlK
MAWHSISIFFTISMATERFEKVSWDVLKDFDKDGEADWMEVVKVFEALKYTWGGRFHSIVDQPHFEKNFRASLE